MAAPTDVYIGSEIKDLQIPFPSEQAAEIAWNSLRVDPEPKRSGVTKKLESKANILHVHFEAKETKNLRVSMNGFLTHLNLVVETMERFGPQSINSRDAT